MFQKFITTMAVSLTIGLSAGMVNAETIDFSSYADGTALSSLGNVSFSLEGGPGVIGTPTIGLQSFGEGGLINSTLGGIGNGYPTTNILAFTFAGLASDISMAVWEISPVTFTAFDESSNIVSSGSFLGNNVMTTIGGSGIQKLVLNNNSGDSNWVFSVSRMEYTVSAVPVPAALPLMASALGMFGVARRRKTKKA